MDKEIAQLEKDLAQYKITQATQMDSSNYYVVEYDMGRLISTAGRWRKHTIQCIPYSNSENAIFMPELCPDNLPTQGSTGQGRLLTLSQDTFTWWQFAITSQQAQNENYVISVPKSISIFSNVNFYIKTSYIDG